MEYLPDRLTFRCNGCGEKFDEVATCPHCKTSLCPNCGRSGCITNVIEMQRMTIHSVELKSQLKKKNGSKPKKAKDVNKRIEELMAKTE